MAIKAESCMVRTAWIWEPRGEFQANFVVKDNTSIALDILVAHANEWKCTVGPVKEHSHYRECTKRHVGRASIKPFSRAMIWDWNVNNNTPTGRHKLQTKLHPPPAPPSSERARDRHRIGMERGIKGGDNKHLICSLHSFGSAVCRWVNKARSIQCRHVILWPPCHVAVIAAIDARDTVEVTPLACLINGRVMGEIRAQFSQN